MEKKLNFCIIGNAGPLDDYNPFKIIQKSTASEILYILNKDSLTISEIASKLKKDRESVKNTVKSLLKINAIKKENRKYKVNFAIFSEQDQKIIFHIGRNYGESLALRLLENKAEFFNLASMLQSSSYVEVDKIIFALVGCFALDWYCLEELEKNNYLRIHKEQPGRREYILQGAEPFDVNVSQLYWASHSMDAIRYTFTSFGDSAGPRTCLPDILWQAWGMVPECVKMEPELKESFATVLSLYGENLLFECGKAIETLAIGGRMKNNDILFNFLEKSGYILQEGKHYRPNVPLFFPWDSEIIDKINKKVAKIVCEFLEQNYSKVMDALNKITPLLNKIPFEECFVDVWHKIFGYCNMFLVEKGFMYAPRKNPCNAKYLPWITVKEGD